MSFAAAKKSCLSEQVNKDPKNKEFLGSGSARPFESSKIKKIVGPGASYTHIHSNCKSFNKLQVSPEGEPRKLEITEVTDEGAIIAQRKPTISGASDVHYSYALLFSLIFFVGLLTDTHK